ncbi:MAG: hypothetical protein AB8G99_13900, partial [Planctomycetaceae bacterium]
MNQKHLAILRAVAGLMLWLFISLRADGQEFHVDGFDEQKTTWALRFNDSDQRYTQVVQHRREKGAWNQTGNVEVLRLKTVGHNQRLRLEYALPPARPFDELSLSLRIKSNQEGLRLAARVVFVDHLNPRTGRPLTAEIRGDIYRSGGKQQELRCKLDGNSIAKVLQELRNQTSLRLNAPGHTYIDRAVVFCDLNPGACEITLEDLKFGPIIAPSRLATPSGSFIQPASQSQVSTQSPVSRAEMRLGQIQVDGRTFFPRMAIWHKGESVEVLKAAGINTVLIPDAANRELVHQLKSSGMHCIAVPPSPGEGEPSFSKDVLFWYLGTRIPSGDQKRLVNWSKWLRTFDDQRRPIMADVTGSERMFSRHVGLLGLSRPVLGTSISLRDYRNTLQQRKMLAQPGMFTWTWIQADAPTAHAKRSGTPYVVEPEQLRLQTYAAISAGSKAIGYWNTDPLNTDRPGDVEQRLMTQQLNLELSLIEDWLSAGQLTGNVTCEAGVTASARATSAAQQAFMENRLRKSGRTSAVGKSRRTNVEAAIFSSAEGQLLLPVWYSQSAQYVPGELVAENLSFVVHVPEAERNAWLVTTTGMRRLETQMQGGGLRVHLSTADRQTFLDQTAIVVVTSRSDVLTKLRSRIATMAETSARISVLLAEAKRNRVQEVEGRIGATDGRTSAMLDRVNNSINNAGSAFARSDYHAARRNAQQAMRYLRRLQHYRWSNAVKGHSTALSSPHTLSYQTLPDHYELLRHMQTVESRKVARLLPAVTGNDAESLTNTGWNRSVSRSENTRRGAQF